MIDYTDTTKTTTSRLRALADDLSEYEEHNADVNDTPLIGLLLHAANDLEKLAKKLIQSYDGMPDHACARCVGEGDLVKSGWQCAYHDAVDIAGERQ